MPCIYCGDKIETIGIDRINSSKGYFIENCTSCYSVCNTMKMNMSKIKFINKIEKIWENIMKSKEI